MLFELGHIRLAQERTQEAIARLQELRWGYPAFPQRRAAQKLLGDTYFQLGQYAAAIELYLPLVSNSTISDDRGRFSDEPAALITTSTATARPWRPIGKYSPKNQTQRD